MMLQVKNYKLQMQATTAANGVFSVTRKVF